MMIRLGIMSIALCAGVACATTSMTAAPQQAAAAPSRPRAAAPLVSLCTMDQDCPQGQECCEQLGSSPVCCDAD